jgi:hypothetical protein
MDEFFAYLFRVFILVAQGRGQMNARVLTNPIEHFFCLENRDQSFLLLPGNKVSDVMLEIAQAESVEKYIWSLSTVCWRPKVSTPGPGRDGGA